MKTFPSKCIDLICTDPPYNLGKDYGNTIDKRSWAEYEKFTQQWLNEAVRLLRDNGTIYVFMGVRFISRLYSLLENEFDLLFNGWITWHYTQGMGRTKGFSPRHEDILCFVKGKGYTFNLDDIRVPQKYYRHRNNMDGANPGDVWQFSHVHYCSKEREKHPTQKPEALMERMIRASSNTGDIVLDPFVGSGTTCKVAKSLGRHWIGIDINPDYIAKCEKRLSRLASLFDSIDPRINRKPLDLKKEFTLPTWTILGK
ncbi:MAG: site-specific DNA-methyltransferase [candidate division Zixibacteria bacterium]|nr:site-specific DNA-methyltransferase [candidate division Zixibacteria bacterium]